MEKYTEEWIKKKIKEGRDYIKYPAEADDGDYKSDQELKKPQPPLYKTAVSDQIIKLPRDFGNLELENNILSVIYSRKSSRVYTDKPINLLQLSYLLWACQGVKEIRGKSYATIRTFSSKKL